MTLRRLRPLGTKVINCGYRVLRRKVCFKNFSGEVTDMQLGRLNTQVIERSSICQRELLSGMTEGKVMVS